MKHQLYTDRAEAIFSDSTPNLNLECEFNGYEYIFQLHIEKDPTEHYPHIEITDIFSQQLKRHLINPKSFFSKKIIIENFKFGDLVLGVMNHMENQY